MSLSTLPLEIPLCFSLVSHSLDGVSADEELFGAAQTLLDTVDEWDTGKVYEGDVHTFTSKPKDSKQMWHARKSLHSVSTVTFRDLWGIVGPDGMKREVKFIPLIQKVTHLRSITDEKGVWSIQFTAQTPFSPRIFNFLRLTQLVNNTDGSQAGTIVMIPLDISQFEEATHIESGVKGKLVLVERVRECDGDLDWRCALAMDQGGMVPAFFTDKSINSKLASVVPNVIHALTNPSQQDDPPSE
ncbi:hypothetical protein DL96DRAFT_1209534 [Flagelloscypha sp. PMI_526]|nr:hypothetical protein DL96DRAFT_1209534 [Flagelloscypha sp. PMI_526]